MDDYIRMLKGTTIDYVRERNISQGAAEKGKPSRLSVMRKIHDAGLRVVAFYDLGALRPRFPRNQLIEDLLAVYNAARERSAQVGSVVDAWEMVGEPDTFFCADLPERVAAFQKAVYLGIKDGNPKAGVLMGALGHYPSPWLSRAIANGLYDYTDALNFHFYGIASDLTGVIRAQRRTASLYTTRELPLWITECGMNAVPKGRPDDAHARKLQRDFTVETADIARREGVAVFMPYILIGRREGESLVKSPSEPYPAWTAYTEYIRKHPLPPTPALDVPVDPSRVVLQWLPDRGSCTPHKVAGAYWFLGGPLRPKPVSGAILAYNFSSDTVKGTLRVEAPSRLALALDGRETPAAAERQIQIPAHGVTRIPIRVSVEPGRYFRGDVRAVFEPGRKNMSRLAFAFETAPAAALLGHVFPIMGERPEPGGFSWIWTPEAFHDASPQGPWLGVNGVKISGGDGARRQSLSESWTFEIAATQDDPRLPPMAVTRVDGLPDCANGFVRLTAASADETRADIRVDLVDKHGQRFTISENFGENPYRPGDGSIYLAYRDFHIYQWGRCTETPVFRPADVREVQLRFFTTDPGVVTNVRLDVVAPGPASGS